MVRARTWALAAAAISFTIIACAGTEDAAPSSSSGSSGQLPGPADGGGPAEELQACATDTKKATTLPLDLYVMFDSSGSMASLVAPNKTRYAAATEAFGAFLGDPGSAGIGMGLQFFPLRPAGVPTTCTTSADCPGNSGPCSVKVCANGAIKYCNSIAECGGGAGNCVAASTCSIQTNTYCSPVGLPCGDDGVSGFDQGDCQAVTTGYCTGGDSCSAPDYATPAVSIAALPGNAQAINSALAARMLASATPTSAALQGAIDGATAHATANEGHAVVVVFITDGLPQGCDENIDNIAGIAGAGLAAAKSIKTFVVGVFNDADKATAQASLDKIADKGGSGKAFIVGAGGFTSQGFLTAMNSVRGSALPCDYNIPQPATGTPDFTQLNVQRTDPSGAKKVYPYAKSAATCDGAGGWYYDQDPSGGGTPTKIILCPASCDEVKSGGQVDVVIGCQTIIK